jgi:hypothetical protein
VPATVLILAAVGKCIGEEANRSRRAGGGRESTARERPKDKDARKGSRDWRKYTRRVHIKSAISPFASALLLRQDGHRKQYYNIYYLLS